MSLINRSAVKKHLLECSEVLRGGKFTRVSSEVLDALEGYVKSRCEQLVRAEPTVGKTIYGEVRASKSTTESTGG